MAHIEPRPRDAVDELKGIFSGAEAAMGFVPNSMLTMAHMPQLPAAFFALTSVVFGGDLKAAMPMLERSVADDAGRSDNLSADLVQLIAFAVSVAAGCRYCQAHTSHQMVERGGDLAKLDAILEFETEPAFSESERTVVAIAMAAGQNPNASTPEMFESLKTHFSSRQIVQIVSIIALFGFLNRWNDTMATALELPAAEFAASALGAVDWTVGKHGSN